MSTEAKKVRTVVWLPPEISRRLRRTKADQMIPVTTQIERIVAEYFASNRQQGRKRIAI